MPLSQKAVLRRIGEEIRENQGKIEMHISASLHTAKHLKVTVRAEVRSNVDMKLYEVKCEPANVGDHGETKI